MGPELQRKLQILGLRTVEDLIEDFPRRYDDYSHVMPTTSLRPGMVTVQAVITQVTGRYVRRGMHITEAVASDDVGSVRLVWFNQPYRAAAIKHDVTYYISGDYALRNQRFSITNPSMELVGDFPVNTARIVPVYRETKGLTSAQLRKLLKQALPVICMMPDTLPDWVLRQHHLMPRAQAYQTVHFPRSAADLATARYRLGFEEVFGLSLAALMNKAEIAHQHAVAVAFDQRLAQEFVAHLPFTLTDAQRKAVWQIYQDMERTQPMNRLVEGDVGSGKTVVAAMAAVMAMHQGFQVALMAPTELLARQHAETVYDLLKPLRMADGVSLLVGSMNASQKQTVHRRVRQGRVQFIIGTHALLQDAVAMHNLGLVIVDEQHRFGVEQRKALLAKAGHAVHVLTTTATPIPRSLALTLYGELDISIIDVKPSGRKPIITRITSPNSREQLYTQIATELDAQRQMFVVCPLITESDAVAARSAEQVFMELKKAFPHHRVGLLHGKQKSDEKDAAMQAFVAHSLDILVSTTVIEVGVNVPNATVMLIENAERFGLAQIHQLRGRVGRSEHQGYCYLMMGDSSQPSRRLRALESSQDGFKLAELDLEIRGPGAIYGTSQHGALDLRIAQLTDVRLIKSARDSAQSFLQRQERLLDYKELHKRVTALRAVTNLN